ncbi:MAG: FG-GAP-like repeat-containing protein [Pseudomonadota bacterium]|nr:FG-GAP-like repeat-containing protein [Pseudomonadota bacterium]
MRPVLLLLLLAAPLASACQDYDLNTNKDEGADDTAGGSVPPVEIDYSEVCEGLTGSPHDVALNTECDVGLQTGTFTPVVEYHYGTTSFCGPPAVGQIVDSNASGAIDDGDMPAIVIFQGGLSGTDGGRVVAVKGDNSGVYWETDTGMGQDGGFAIGDLDGDGWPEVVVGGVSNVRALDGRTGAVVWTSPNVSSSVDALGYNHPSISDMDHDGHPEVTVGSVILNHDGSLRGRGRLGIGGADLEGDSTYGISYGALSVPVDLDRDGTEELVTGNAAYNPDGSVKWQNDGRDGLIAVADFDGDGEGEIVKTSGWFITGMESDGTEVWGPVNYGYYGVNVGPPSVDDLDGDGVPDIVFAAQSYLVAMEWGGIEKWKASVDDFSGAAGAVLFDFEMDGYPEVLYADETNVRFFSGLDGAVKMDSDEHGSRTIVETPVVADVDNDGHVEIVVGHCSWNKSFTVYGDADDSWPAGRKIWNQHGYSITNVGDHGEIPVTASPNWPEHNSFRSGDVGQPPGEYLDVQAEIFDVCETECADGVVFVGAWLTNAGNQEAPAGLPVSVRAGPSGAVLSTQYTTLPVPSGKTGEALFFELDASALGGAEPFAVADADATLAGMLFECDEGNNVDAWSDAVCE